MSSLYGMVGSVLMLGKRISLVKKLIRHCSPTTAAERKKLEKKAVFKKTNKQTKNTKKEVT